MLSRAAIAELVRACRQHPLAGEQPMAISIVDNAGEVLRQRRVPSLHPLFGALSAAKASTCIKFGMPRAELQDWQRRKPVLHMQLSTLDRWPVVATGGSSRLEVGGDLLGGLGIATPDGLSDQQICDDALSDLGYAPDGAPQRPAARISANRTQVKPSDGSTTFTDTADAIVDAVIDRAGQRGLAVAVAVVDQTGALLSSFRTHPSARTLELAEAKGYSSVVMGHPTIDLESDQLANPVLAMQLSAMGPHPIIADFGGYPIRTTGHQLIGGLGISGARGEEDQELCEHVLRDLGFVVEEQDES